MRIWRMSQICTMRANTPLLHDPDGESHQEEEQAYTRIQERYWGLLQKTKVKFSNDGDNENTANGLVSKGHLLKTPSRVCA